MICETRLYWDCQSKSSHKTVEIVSVLSRLILINCIVHSDTFSLVCGCVRVWGLVCVCVCTFGCLSGSGWTPLNSDKWPMATISVHLICPDKMDFLSQLQLVIPSWQSLTYRLGRGKLLSHVLCCYGNKCQLRDFQLEVRSWCTKKVTLPLKTHRGLPFYSHRVMFDWGVLKMTSSGSHMFNYWRIEAYITKRVQLFCDLSDLSRSTKPDAGDQNKFKTVVISWLSQPRFAVSSIGPIPIMSAKRTKANKRWQHLSSHVGSKPWFCRGMRSRKKKS